MQNIKIPPLYCPFPGAIHQNVATAQEQTNKWVRVKTTGKVGIAHPTGNCYNLWE